MSSSPSLTRASTSVVLLLVSGFWILASLPAPAIVDTNNNTLSDIWEKQYNNGNLIANLDPQADPDSDGWTNMEEAAAGTNPFDPNPPNGFIRPDIVHIPATYSSGTSGDPEILTPEAIALTWPTLPGKQYTLHYSPDLSEGSWEPVEAPYIGNGNDTQYGIPLTQENGSTPDKLFWRVAVEDIDTDGDSLSNYEESILGTNSNNSDTDFDGIADNLDITPLANNAITDPDGDNLPASLATGLTGRWDLETITTANGVRASPNTANPSIPAYLGGAIEADNNGMVSKSVRMSAMNQYIKTDPSIITGKASFSISFWFRFEKNYLQNKPGSFHTVLFAFNDVIDSTPLFQLHAYKALSTLGTQKLIFSHYDNHLVYPDIIGEIPLSAPLDEGNWQHLTLTKSSGTIQIYRDSQQLVSGSGLSGVLQSTTNGYFCFGALVPTTLGFDSNFRGSMDRLRTWSRAISQPEVSALYHQDIDRDGLWDITENNTRYSDYSNSVIIHPDPANPTAPQPTQTGYARSPFLHSSAALDFDQDELNDLAEQTAGTNLTKPDTDDDNLTDGFEIFNNFNPLNAYSLGATGPRDDLGDPDSDTLITLTEYLNGSNPRNSNSDGDGKNDSAEIAQGSDPANAADSGAAPADPPESVPLHINGDYTAWEATLKGKGPNDTRTRRFRMSAHNVAADQTLPLLRGNAYELSLRYIRTKPGESVPWYCWEASIAGKNTPAFTIANHWVVDNSRALLAAHTHSHGTNLVADKKVNLLPVEVKDIKDSANTGDDVTITPWDTATQTNPTDANIAWIEPHKSATDAAPRMPQLELKISGLPATTTIQAKIEVQYTRGNGARAARNQAEDRVRIPADGSFQTVAGDTWKIWEAYAAETFFGGEATLTYKLMTGTTETLAPQIIRFRIGGKNPDPARARTYIESLADCNSTGSLWFAYAIARSESQDYNGNGSRYNQFLRLPQNPIDNSRPLWGNDGGARPGGYGMFQVTGNVQDSEVNIPRAQIWNWQTNTDAARIIIVDKRRASTNWMTTQSNATHANGTAIPSHTVGNVTFDGTNHTLLHACTIKAYNGASKPTSDTDNDTIAGFVLDPSYPTIGHYGYWHAGSSKWGLCRFNNLGFNYVSRVCGEVQP